MGSDIVMKNSTKGFYTLEASIVLPLIILAILSLGYFMKVEGTWENCIHGAIDESGRIAAKSYDKGMAIISKSRIQERILEENSDLETIEISDVKIGYQDLNTDKLTSYKINATMTLELPLGFNQQFNFNSRIKFRGFVGKKVINAPLGNEGLETDLAKNPVWVFPQSGKKYHGENCTYVKASVKQKLLTNKLKREYSSCMLCSSDEVRMGSIVFCFESKGTAYHKGTCGTIKRHTVIIDKSEAQDRGYRPCSKCKGE